MKGTAAASCICAAAFITAAVPFLAHADVSAVAFTSAPQTIAPDAVSEQLTIQLQDGSGNSAKAPSTACASLTSSSASGQFSSSATSWNPVSVLTISKNSANRNFYYKDGSSGTHTLTARVAQKPEGESRSCTAWPVAEWPVGWSATEEVTVGSAGNTGENAAASTSPEDTANAEPAALTTESGNGSVGGAYEQRIFASAKLPAKGVAGADLAFEAVAIGLKKEPISNARFIWSFGDGAAIEGKRVYHAYHYPGTYVVLVEASSGEWSATDRRDITIVAPLLALRSVRTGANGFIEVANDGKDDIDLSRWFLRSGGSFFSFPEGTIVKAGSSVLFAAAVTKLAATESGAELLYPNGTVAAAHDSRTAEPAPVLPSVEHTAAPVPLVSGKKAPERIARTEAEPEERSQTAASQQVAAAAGNAGRTGTWFFATLALSITVAVGYLITARKKEVPKAEGLSAKEFEIVE